MRVAALYDVHGNLPALDAVLAEIDAEGVDVVVSGGDLLGPAFPVDVFDRLAERSDVRFVRGNVEREVLARSDFHGAAEIATQLGTRRLEALADWPLSTEVAIDRLGPVFFCHATPRSDEEIVTRITPEAEVADAFALAEGIAVVGHTHVQFDRTTGGKRIVNAGSVGMPYEGRRGAYWAMLASDIDLRATEYDVERAAKAAAEAGAADVAEWLREPPDPSETSAYFESQRGA